MKSGLEDTLNKTSVKPNNKEMEDLLSKANMLDNNKNNKTNPLPKPKTVVKKIEAQKSSLLENGQTIRTKKINVILPEVEHQLYKLHCGLNNIGIQDKAKELILDWLKKQPKLGI